MTQPTKSPIPSKVNYPEVVDQTGINLFAFDGEGVSYKDNPNKSYSWKPFQLKITADQNPDPGNVINDQAHYLQVGAILFVMYNFEKSDGGSDGSGDYIFSMPPGFKVDTDIVPVVPSASFGLSTATRQVLANASGHATSVRTLIPPSAAVISCEFVQLSSHITQKNQGAPTSL